MDCREKMRKYVKPSATLKLKQPNGIEDVFEIKPLPMTEYPEFFELIRKLDVMQKEAEAKKIKVDMIKFMTPDNITMIVKLEKRSIINSFKLDEIKDVDLIDGFILNNFMDLFNAIIEANMVTGEESQKAKVMNRINQLKGDPIVNRIDVEDNSRQETRAIKSGQATSP